MASTPLRKTYEAVVWYRGPITGPLTVQSLSALLTSAATAPDPTDFRCQIRCTDGFSLRLYGVGDEGFESDEGDVSPAVGGDDRSQDEIRVSDHAIPPPAGKADMMEEDSSSANSSCSDTDDPNSSTDSASPPSTSSTCRDVTVQVIHGADMLFCHTDPTVPRGVLFVTRQPRPARMDDALEAIVLRCARETVAKDLYTTYHEVTRRLKWERYTNAKRKSDVIRASFRNINSSLRLRPADHLPADAVTVSSPSSGRSVAQRQLVQEQVAQPRSLVTLYPESERRLEGCDSGPHSLPPPGDISRILSLSTPENDWSTTESHAVLQRFCDDEMDDGSRGRPRLRASCQTTARYAHNKGPAPPVPAPRQHPTNPNLMLVPTKNGLEPYRVIGSDPPPRPMLLYAAEFSPHFSGGVGTADWGSGHKMSQFDANNNRSRASGRQPLYWVPGGEASGWSGGWKPELRPRARSKSPAERHRGFELAGALSSALRGIKGQLRRAPAEAPPAVAPVNPKSVMKKRDRVAGSPETKRVTFSAYSTVQVMD